MHETRTGIGVSDWWAPPGFVLRQSSAIVAIARTRMGSAGKSLWAASDVWKGGSCELFVPAEFSKDLCSSWNGRVNSSRGNGPARKVPGTP